MNEFEVRARARKVLALVGAIDKLATERGMSPHGDVEQVEAVQELVMAFDGRMWAELTKLARLKSPPSETTIGEVIDAYQRRAELADQDQDPFARFG